MDVHHDRVAGLDVHQATVVACVRAPGTGRARSSTRQFTTFATDLEASWDWLVWEHVTHVAMEATGVYVRPVWYTLGEGGFEMMLTSSRNMRIVPGGKTDVSDAAWIAQLA